MPNTRILRLFSISVFACLLSACDGGLFGTGDGLPIIVNNSDVSTGQSAVDSTDGAESTPTQNEGTAEAPTTVDNLLVGTTTTTPLINVINVSDLSVYPTISAGDDSNLFESVMDTGSVSQTAELALGINILSIINSDTSDVLFNVQPLNVGASTLTTLLIRNGIPQGIDVITLSSLSISPTPAMAQIRIVQASLLSDQDLPASFSLQPNGVSPGAVALRFPDISYASASAAEYQAASTGGYLLIDSLNRMDDVEVELQPGKIYTLIILGHSDTPILLHEDDLLRP